MEEAIIERIDLVGVLIANTLKAAMIPAGTEVMIADLTILEITATNTVVGDIKVDEDIESKNAKDFPYLSIHSKVIYKGVLKTVQLHITEDLDKFGKK